MLRTYSLGRDVQYEDVTETRALLSLVGPAARERLDAAPPAEENSFVTGEHGIYVATLLGVDVICEPGTTLDVEPVSEEAAECVRIEAGRPRLGYDMDADTMPQEAGINERAVSFTKGCYVGQETVARLHYRGKPNRHLRGLRLSRAGRARRPRSRSASKVVGRLGSTCVSPRLGPIALALVRREARAGRDGRRGRSAGRGRGTTVRASLNRADPRAATGSRRTARCSGTARRAPRATTIRRACSTCRRRRRARSSRSTCASCASSCPSAEPGREVDDWGRSQRIFDLVEPLLDFYYRYWFRVEVEGVENVPSDGGALIVSNHSGALPPDAPMIMQAIRNEHPQPRPLYMLGENWFKGYPGVGMLANKIGLVAAHPANAQRLLRDEGRLVLVFPEGQKGSRKLFWQRYKLRRFGRGGFVRTAMRAGVPIVPDRGDRRRGGDADLRPRAAAPAAHRAHLLPDQPRLPALRPRRRPRCTCPRSSGSASSSRSTCRRYAPEDADDIALVGRLVRAHPAAHPGGAGRPPTGAQVRLVRLSSLRGDEEGSSLRRDGARRSCSWRAAAARTSRTRRARRFGWS